MSLADDLAWTLADRMAHGDGPRPGSPEDTQRTGEYLPDARDAVDVVLAWLIQHAPEQPLAVWGTVELTALADEVERGGRAE
ncbi:MAG TPA: hypothetical protein VHX38_02015 [Pseudonocardiaceae bacterium]|jgi:hypothetical protein|nr:hypothetical protein [Pseudonocardiaceae bacterium]